jgi:hypothetical protein
MRHRLDNSLSSSLEYSESSPLTNTPLGDDRVGHQYRNRRTSTHSGNLSPSESEHSEPSVHSGVARVFSTRAIPVTPFSNTAFHLQANNPPNQSNLPTAVGSNPNTAQNPINQMQRRWIPMKSPDEMPRVGSKSAPRKFKGEYDYVDTFLKQYEQLCASHNVVTDQDKCDRLVDYVSGKVE